MPTKPPNSSTKPSTSSDRQTLMFVTPSLTLTWLAWTPKAAQEAKESLDDQLRGAQMGPWIHGWRVEWATWVEHTTYGVHLWCEPLQL